MLNLKSPSDLRSNWVLHACDIDGRSSQYAEPEVTFRPSIKLDPACDIDGRSSQYAEPEVTFRSPIKLDPACDIDEGYIEKQGGRQSDRQTEAEEEK
ncbi:hypothetical protein PoB_004654800 [Plakobranchus ocellatus]|uniref:ZP domain-containing protein n=1 Tax=Plakobranchus ocellatus TaxID=259542 RepID=A0AAV4BLJ9_9GAST|nr:hypothetical protein PoB_004654800 [Plakobranchus ocellatus]